MVHGDLSGLIIKGKPSPDELAFAWANIYRQYIDLNADVESNYILQLQVDITLLKGHISEVETCLYFLKDTFHNGLLNILSDHGYTPPTAEMFDDKSRYFNHLGIIQNRLAKKNLDLTNKQKEYSDYMADKNNDDIGADYFDKTLMRLAKYQGVGVIMDTQISTRQFILLLKDYLEHLKSKQADIDGNQR